MEVRIKAFHSEIILDDTEIKELCKIGQGADCCIWLCVGGEGFECLYHNKPLTLIERLEKGDTVAKRDGCDKVKTLKFSTIETN